MWTSPVPAVAPGTSADRADSGLNVNCGYGHGYSVRQVIDAVRRVHGSDFEVNTAGRRAGDPSSIVANCDRARTELGWIPQYDDLDGIVADALSWERRLTVRNSPHGDPERIKK